MKFATKLYDITHLTLRMLLHYLGKLKIQILCRYARDMKESAKKFYHCCRFTRTCTLRVFAIANPSVVCLSSVTFVRPTQGLKLSARHFIP